MLFQVGREYLFRSFVNFTDLRKGFFNKGTRLVYTWGEPIQIKIPLTWLTSTVLFSAIFVKRSVRGFFGRRF